MKMAVMPSSSVANVEGEGEGGGGESIDVVPRDVVTRTVNLDKVDGVEDLDSLEVFSVAS